MDLEKNIETKTFRMKVVEKNMKEENNQKKYFVTLQIINESVQQPRPVVEREMTIYQYDLLNLQDIIGVCLYSNNPPKINPDKGRAWYFSEVELMKEKDEGIGALIRYIQNVNGQIK